MRQVLFCLILGLLIAVDGFVPLSIRAHDRSLLPFSVCSVKQRDTALQLVPNETEEKKILVGRVLNRLDTLKAAGLKTGKTDDPQYQIGFRNGLILFVVAFGYKWYRARFINKIPVWDRQPQWNTVVTTKEQEQELKAYTCKTCGSTIFIARHRRWYFEGTFGLGGLGCYTCGAKGKDNFVMDRDRIVEDVGEEDDYFDYERPLDFVSAAERRQLMKETGGDEDAANKLLVDRSEESGETEPSEDLPDFADAEIVEDAAEEAAEETVEDAVVAEATIEDAPVAEETLEETAVVAETSPISDVDDDTSAETAVAKDTSEEESVSAKKPEAEALPEEPSPKEATKTESSATNISDDDIFDLLDMD